MVHIAQFHGLRGYKSTSQQVMSAMWRSVIARTHGTVKHDEHTCEQPTLRSEVLIFYIHRQIEDTTWLKKPIPKTKMDHARELRRVRADHSGGQKAQ